jgi:cytochrome bd-type quinol oxidase subunit 1
MDVLTLSRIQFGATIAFHYIYSPLSIGLGVILVIMEAAWLKTKNPLYHQMARYWTKVFALTFAIGVTTVALFTIHGAIYGVMKFTIFLCRYTASEPALA